MPPSLSTACQLRVNGMLDFNRFTQTAPASESKPSLLKQCLVLRLIDQLVFGDPRHHRAQLAAHFFDLMLGSQTTA